MDTRDSLLARQGPIVAAAILAAATTAPSSEFRPKDVKFFLDLFSDWIELTYWRGFTQIQNVQVNRFLTTMTSRGVLVMKARGGKRKYFSVTRTGIAELAGLLVGEDTSISKERFLFVRYFILCYSEQIHRMLAEDRTRYPSILDQELKHLLDPARLLHLEQERVRENIKRLKIRIDMAEKSVHLFEQEQKKGKSFEESLSEIQRQYPYAMNNLKPLSELIRSLPHSLQTFELGQGGLARSREMWKPQLRLLESYLHELEQLVLEE